MGLPTQPQVRETPRDCEDDKKKSADSRLAVVIEVNDNNTNEVSGVFPQTLMIIILQRLVVYMFPQKLMMVFQ